jgi:hypothetical protein
MGQVLELRQKISTDWTPVERLQLDTLVSCLPVSLAQEVEFGVSDSGDPWCAVLNEDGEVVLHVARIAGRFYVHSTIEPFVAEARDLPAAVAPFIGDSFLQQRHVATITPMYGLVLPLHAYAMPSDMPVEPRAEMIGDGPAVQQFADETPPPELPQAPEPWSAPIFTLGAAVEQPLELQPQIAEQVLFPIQESDWVSPMSSQLLDFSAAPRIEPITSLQLGDVTFEPFILPEAAPAVAPVQLAEATDDPAETVAPDPDGEAFGGGNVINVDFGQSSSGANNGFMGPQSDLATGALDGLDRAAAGVELVISDVEPGVIVAWSDTPATLMGITPVAEAF